MTPNWQKFLIFFSVCTCILHVLLFLKENMCLENFSLICKFFSCVKVALPEYFVRICANIRIKCITRHCHTQNSIATADESHSSFKLLRNFFQKASRPDFVNGISYPRGTDYRVGSPTIAVAVERFARDTRIVIHFILE
jgi:hypothetical protein